MHSSTRLDSESESLHWQAATSASVRLSNRLQVASGVAIQVAIEAESLRLRLGLGVRIEEPGPQRDRA